MKRILIMGNPGAGKSTLAIKLGELLGLPVIHLDKEYWQAGWVETERDLWRQKVRKMAATEEWIMDGTYRSTVDIRLPLADTVIYLDFPTHICLWRIFKRVFKGYNKSRPDMAEGCPEKVDFEFIKWTLNFRRDVRPGMIAAIRTYFKADGPIFLKNAREIEEFLQRYR